MGNPYVILREDWVPTADSFCPVPPSFEEAIRDPSEIKLFDLLELRRVELDSDVVVASARLLVMSTPYPEPECGHIQVVTLPDDAHPRARLEPSAPLSWMGVIPVQHGPSQGQWISNVYTARVGNLYLR